MLKYCLGVAAAALMALTIGTSTTEATAAKLEPGCYAPAPTCCYNPCIKYKHRPGKKICCCAGCPTPVEIVLEVQDPNCCECVVAVPVCILACCEGEPCVTSHCGIFGRGIVNYEWPNGYRVRVAFAKSGDIAVTTFGR